MNRNSLVYYCFFIIIMISAILIAYASSAAILDTTADLVLGQPDFSSHAVNAGVGSVNSTGVNAPFAVAIDQSVTPNHVYVTDMNNNRVLGWADEATLINGQPADKVFGQQGDFTSRTCNNGGRSADTLCTPQGLTVDTAGNLYVADRGNSRVLVYLTPFSSTAIAGSGDTTADFVFGQTSFNQGGCSNPTLSTANASSLCNPLGVAVDSLGNVYVADTTNNRVLEYNTPLTISTPVVFVADRVFGQPDFSSRTAGSGADGLNQPYAVAVDSAGNVYVADFQNNRVLEYDTPLSTDTVADLVFGQTNFSSTSANSGGISAGSLSNPTGVAVDSVDNLYVADRSNRRVLEYDTPLTTDTIADLVFGQGGFSTIFCNPGGVATASSLCIVTGVDVDGSGDLWVADFSNNRVLKYDPADQPPQTTTTSTTTTTIPTASSSNLSSQQTGAGVGGGCGMIDPKNGDPPVPAKGADMPILLAVMLFFLMKKKIQSLKQHVCHLLTSRPSSSAGFQISSRE